MHAIAFVMETIAMLTHATASWPLLFHLLQELAKLWQWQQELVQYLLLHHGNVLSALVHMENVLMSLIMVTAQPVMDQVEPVFT